MKYGFIAYGNLKPEYNKKPIKEIHQVMKTVQQVAQKHEIEIKMYGVPYGVSEDFVVVYESNKGLVNYYNFGTEANLPYTNTRTNQVSIDPAI
jgi:hypothetical protein